MSTSIGFGSRVTTAQPGSLDGLLLLAVEDPEAAARNSSPAVST